MRARASCGLLCRSASPTQLGTEHQLVRLPLGSWEGFFPSVSKGLGLETKREALLFTEGSKSSLPPKEIERAAFIKRLTKGLSQGHLGLLGRSWEVGKCLILGCGTRAGCVWFLWRVSVSGFMSSLWNEVISFNLVQFTLNSQANRVPLISWKSA